METDGLMTALANIAGVVALGMGALELARKASASRERFETGPRLRVGDLWWPCKTALPVALPYLAASVLLLLLGHVAAVPAPVDRDGRALTLVVTPALALLLPIGLMLFEAGVVAEPYRAESASKNLQVFLVSLLAFVLVGRWVRTALLSVAPLLDPAAAAPLAAGSLTGLALHAIFATTAALLVANTITERTTLPANLTCAAIAGGLAYPVMAALFAPDGLAARRFGFVDAGGASSVFLLGGASGLFAARHIGSRFRAQAWHLSRRPPRPRHDAFIPLAILGGLLSCAGSIGLNARVAVDLEQLERGLLNTLIGAAGGAVPLLARWVGEWLDRVASGHRPATGARRPPAWLRDLTAPERTVFGLLGGLAAVAANATRVTPGQALLEAAIGGVVAVGGSVFLEYQSRRIDDPLGAISIGAGAGLVGLLFTPLWCPEARWSVQVMGAAAGLVVAAVSIGLARVPFRLLDPLGVSARLTAYHQLTGKALPPPPPPGVILLPRSAGTPAAGARSDPGLAPTVLSDGENMATRLMEVLWQTFSGDERQQRALATIDSLSEEGALPRYVQMVGTLRSYPGPSDKPWKELSVLHREGMVWTIWVLAEALGIALLTREAPDDGDVDPYASFLQARALLGSIKEDDLESPDVRAMARSALRGLRATPAHRAWRRRRPRGNGSRAA